jgi:hypothetical protein
MYQTLVTGHRLAGEGAGLAERGAEQSPLATAAETCRIGGRHLADYQPIEQHPDASKMLLHSGLRARRSPAPRKRRKAPAVRAYDDKEFEEAPGGPLPGPGDQGRESRAPSVLAMTARSGIKTTSHFANYLAYLSSMEQLAGLTEQARRLALDRLRLAPLLLLAARLCRSQRQTKTGRGSWLAFVVVLYKRPRLKTRTTRCPGTSSHLNRARWVGLSWRGSLARLHKRAIVQQIEERRFVIFRDR